MYLELCSEGCSFGGEHSIQNRHQLSGETTSMASITSEEYFHLRICCWLS